MWWEYEIKWKKRPWAGLLVLGVGRREGSAVFDPRGPHGPAHLLQVENQHRLVPSGFG